MTWRVWARITGPKLPAEAVWIGAARVGPAPGEYRPPSPVQLNVKWADGEQSEYTTTSPRVAVTSDCWIIVEGVEARDNWAAISQVEEREIPAVVAALSAGRPEGAYRVELVGADNGAEGFGVSPTVSTTALPKSNLGSYEVIEAKTRMALLLDHPSLTTAAELLYRGIRYSDMVAGPLSSAAAILAFYQVVESLATLIPWTPAEDYEVQRAQVVKVLRDKLARLGAVKKQAAAIEEARNNLARLDARFGSLRIEHAAETFGINEAWIIRARELGKLRNRSLGHAARLPSVAVLAEWDRVDGTEPFSAYGLASVMLAAEFAHLSIPPT